MRLTRTGASPFHRPVRPPWAQRPAPTKGHVMFFRKEAGSPAQDASRMLRPINCRSSSSPWRNLRSSLTQGIRDLLLSGGT